jgi:hypothetical protein
MSEADTAKATTKAAAKGGEKKKRAPKPVEPTAASNRPSRTHRKPNRFDFTDEKAAVGSTKRKRAASKERSPAKKRKTTSKSPTRKAGAGKKGAAGGRKKKDPNAPKRAMSAYMFYAQANRDKVKKDHPGASFGEIGKILGKMWGKASASEKSKYEAKAEKDKERYEKEVGGGGRKKSSKKHSEESD